MRIVTFNNKGTGHLVRTTAGGGIRLKTLCKRVYPGARGRLRIEPHQDGPGDDHLHLCGLCQDALESSVVVSVNEHGRKTYEPRLQRMLRHAQRREAGRILRAI